LRCLEDLRAIPTIDADIVRQHLLAMATTQRLSGVADPTSTGGTGGAPLHFYIGADRSVVEYSHLIAGWERVGYRLGTPLAVFRGRIVQPDRNGLYHEYDPLLRHHHYSTFHMADDEIRRSLEHIRRIGPCYLHVYPSSVSILASFIRRTGAEAPANIRGIIAESEIVYPEQRQLAEDVFACRYFSCYGHTEKVLAAAECEHSTDYHVWPTYGYLELLDETGMPVTTSGQAGEVVGTGFINTVVPFIRYRTGDFATYAGRRCEACGRSHTLLQDVRGHRTQEVLLLSDGSEVSWTALNMHDDTFVNVQRFQFYQDAPGKAVLRIVPADDFSDEDRNRIAKSLRRKTDGRLEIKLETLGDVALSPRGKGIYVDQRTGFAP
jgi:phenylacetate-CoA ligase